MKDLYHPSKKEFQLERIILFSDAVFAIAITLLIIDIKVPDIEGMPVSESSFLTAFLSAGIKYFSFLMSFAMIAYYWAKHHQIFGFITKFTSKLIFLNFLFLLGIVVMPYSAGVYSEYSEPRYVLLLLPFLIYVLNVCYCETMIFILWNYISNISNGLIEAPIDSVYIKNQKRRSFILPVAFVFTILLCWITNSPVARFALCIIPFLFMLIKDEPSKKRK